MGQIKWIALLGLVTSLISIPALADSPASETRPIDSNISKIFFGGVANLQLHQGATPSLVIIGDPEVTKQIISTQNGDTLRIDTHSGFFLHTPSSHVEITLPKLTNFTSNGVGSLQISGFSGDNLQLEIKGAGDVAVNVHYKHLTARSSGVAAITLNNDDSDDIEVSLPGAGHMALSGQTKNLICRLNGIGSLDARELKANMVTTYINGVGSAKVFAKDSAEMHLHGVGSAIVYGNPTVRNTEVSGLGKVAWGE